jgi:valyl-tRNA synthetase
MNLDGYDADRWLRDVYADGQWRGLSPADRWILRRACEVADEVNHQLEDWRLDLAAHGIYQFVWGELCDWYLELAKRTLRSEDAHEKLATQGTLATVLDLTLRLLHPITPFITEQIWQQLPKPSSEDALMVATYPRRDEHHVGPFPGLDQLDAADPGGEASADIAQLIAVVQKVRNLKSEVHVPPAKKVDVWLVPSDAAARARIDRIADGARFVGRFESLRLCGAGESLPREVASDVAGDVEVVLPLAGLIDIAEERARLGKEIEKREKERSGLERKLANEGFVTKAPAQVVEAERARLSSVAETLAKQKAMLARLGG